MRPRLLLFAKRGFTIVELLVSTAIIMMILVLLVQMTGQTNQMWRYTTGKVEQFRESRVGFEVMTRRLSQATLNTYWDYDDPKVPKRYERRSELRFVCGPSEASGADGQPLLGRGSDARPITHCVFFHAPLGMVDPSTPPTAQDPGYKGLEGLLNTCGYFVEYGDDLAFRPAFITSTIMPARHRFRLMEFVQPSEQLKVYNGTSGKDSAEKPKSLSYNAGDWYRADLSSAHPPVRVLAENVVALIITPRLSRREEEEFGKDNPDYSPLAPTYLYDSTAKNADPRINPRNQLPPVLQITIIAVDEASALRLGLGQDDDNLFGLGAGSAKFKQTSKYSDDLSLDPKAGFDPESDAAPLENRLIARKVNYRVFTTNVPIRAAKWSRQQAN